MHNFVDLFEIFARAGGGGSSSSGSGEGFFVVLGYLPSYYLGKIVKRFLPRKLELIVSASFALVASLILLIIGFLTGFTGTFVMMMVITGIWLGWGAAFYGLWEKLKKRADKAKVNIDIAAKSDPAWNEPAMNKLALNTFMQYQKDWSTMNIESIKTYTTPRYALHTGYMIKTLQELGRKNLVENIRIKNCLIVDAIDNVDNSKDVFVVAYEAAADDGLFSNEGEKLFVDKRSFVEYWTYVRSGDKWLLDRITQQTQELAVANASVRDFATKNSMFYSLDMGWLFLPRRGLLFSGGKMGVSDINNHAVGLYHGRLAQIYTYCPQPGAKKPQYYLVMQIGLPKSYGGIIVRPDVNKWFSIFGNIAPAGYKKHEFEWPDFNKRYDVHATDADRLAAFELINPGFMAYLYDNDPGVGIEVTDNVLFLFKKLGQNGSNLVLADAYDKMLTIALKAYKELEL